MEWMFILEFIVVNKISNLLLNIVLYSPSGVCFTTIHNLDQKVPWIGFPGDGFGYIIDSSKQFIIIGCPNDNINGLMDYGSSIIYDKDYNRNDSGFKITPRDGCDECYFGRSAAIDDDRAIIGSRYDNYTAPDLPLGSAYVYKYENGTWGLENKLKAFDANAHDGFGYAVDIDNKTAVVSGFKDDDRGWNSGSVYVFTYVNNTWSHKIKLVPSDLSDWDLFGFAVKIYKDCIAVSAALHNSKNIKNSGAVYIFTRRFNSTWLLDKKIEPQFPCEQGRFGASIDMNKHRLVVGAPGEDDDSGAVYIYQKNYLGDWINETKLIPSDQRKKSFFGWSVSINDKLIAIGSPDSYNNNTHSGAVYLFQYVDGIWKESMKLLPKDTLEKHWFGRSVSLQTKRLFVGKYSDILKENGSVHTFDIVPPSVVEPPTYIVTIVISVIVPLILLIIVFILINKYRPIISKTSKPKDEHDETNERTYMHPMTVQMG